MMKINMANRKILGLPGHLLLKDYFSKQVRCFSYTQGQSPRKGVREYFYYIDHQGQVGMNYTLFYKESTCRRSRSIGTSTFKGPMTREL